MNRCVPPPWVCGVVRGGGNGLTESPHLQTLAHKPTDSPSTT